LRDLSWIEGRNVQIEFRFMGGPQRADVADVAKLSLAGHVHRRHPGPVDRSSMGRCFADTARTQKRVFFPAIAVVF